MGLKVSLIAAKTSRANFEREFFAAWSDLKVAKEREFAAFDDLSSWIDAEYRNHDNILGFYEDSEWAAVFDAGMFEIDMEDSLCRLSESVGPVVVALAQTTSGSYWFKCFESGRLRRTIVCDDGAVESSGAPIAPEDQLNRNQFNLRDVETLLEALGLRPYVADCPGPFHAFGIANPALPVTPVAPIAAPKPWWRFWG